MSLGVIVLMSLLAAASGEPDWSNSDFMYQGREFTRFRTDPSTWAPEGAFGLRWGMGPGDVSTRFRGLEFVFSDPNVSRGVRGSFDDRIEDSTVKVFVLFLRGRLYSIEIDPALLRSGAKNPDYSAEAMTRGQNADWKWTLSLLGTLTRELGEPVCAPSSRTIGRFCFTVTPLPGCGFQDREKIQKLFRWVWRIGRTETLLSGRARLEYSDLQALPRVARGKELAKAEWANKQAQQKAAERSKITGSATAPAESVGLEAGNVEEVGSGQDEVWPLECYADDDEPSKDQRTAQTSWSQVGWDRYRWGMGPADVRALFPPVKGGSMFWDPGTLEPASYLLMGTKVFGEPSSSRFRFVDGRLLSVTHQRDCMAESSQGGLDCVGWSKQIEAAFTKKCGDGRCTRDGKYVECSWACGETEHASLSRYDAGSFQAVSLSYANPANFQKPAPPGFIKTSIPEKSWSAQGWYGFRYSMGPADVQRRLAVAGGDFRAKRGMACVVSKDNPKNVECTLERDFHEMSVVGLKPTLEFHFLDSRLYRVSLTFPKAIEQADFDRASDSLNEMLIEKYGKPTQDFGDKQGPAKSFGAHWDSKELSVNFHAMMTSRGASMFISYFSGVTYRILKQEGQGSAEGSKL